MQRLTRHCFRYDHLFVRRHADSDFVRTPLAGGQAPPATGTASTVPGKPLTEVIVSHHHFDHTGGIRQAMAEGLTLIAHKGT